MSENEYVATAAAQKRLREVLDQSDLSRFLDPGQIGVVADCLLSAESVTIEYKPRAKAVLITLPLPDKAALSQMGTAADLDQAVTGTEGAGNELGAEPVSAEDQAYAEAEITQAPPQPHIVPFAPVLDPDAEYEDVHYD